MSRVIISPVLSPLASVAGLPGRVVWEKNTAQLNASAYDICLIGGGRVAISLSAKQILFGARVWRWRQERVQGATDDKVG